MSFASSTLETKDLNIVSTQTAWKIENDVEWIKLSSLSGNATSSVQVGVVENKSGDNARIGIFYLKSNVEDWKFESPISITQSGAKPIIDLSMGELSFTGAENEAVIEVKSNCSWEIHNSSSSWLKATKKDNSILLSVTSNETTDYRTATVLVEHVGLTNVSRKIIIRQAPASITLSTEELSLSNTANVVEITIESESSWTASCSNSWIELTPSNGKAGTSMMKVNVSPNTSTEERTGYIILSIGQNERIQISVKQQGIHLRADKSELDFNAFGGKAELRISSNTSWMIKDSPSWLSLSKYEGKGDDVIVITAVDNESTNGRFANIKVTQEGLSIGDVISITQDGKYFTISAQSLIFEATTSIQALEIKAEDSWNIQNNSSWIDISQSSGTGNSKINIQAYNNELVNTREAKLYATMLDKTIEIAITQKGKVFSIDTDEKLLTFPAIGGSSSLNVASNTFWQLTDYPSWISLSMAEGRGDAENIVVTAEENPSTTERSSTMLLKMDGKDDYITIALQQSGKSFSITPTKLEFTDKQETKDVFIETDGTWQANTEFPWIEISPSSSSGNSILSISVTENTTESERKGSVSVTMDDKTIEIVVTQKGTVFSIDADKNLLTFPAIGGTSSLNVASNTYWQLTDYPSWISLSMAEGRGDAENIVVTAEENPSTTERSSTMLLKMDGKDDYITIALQQSGKSFSITPTKLEFTDKQETKDVFIETDGTWQANTEFPWIEISPSSSSGNSILSISVTENTTESERKGSVSVTMDDKTLEISITQTGKYLTIANSILSYTSKGGTIDVTITTNDAWTAEIEDDVSWITLSETSGNETVDVEIIAADNPSINERVGSVVIKTINEKSVRIKVTQAPRYLTINHNSILFYSKGGTSEVITISTDGEYEIKGSDFWLSINQFENTFTVTSSENTTPDVRNGYVTITMTDLEEGSFELKLPIIQLNYGGSFLKNNYGDDKNYDEISSSNGVLTIGGFGADKNFDISTSSGIVLRVSGYASDKNWDDIQIGSGVSITKTGYNSDKNHDTTNSTSGSINRNDFLDDKNWQ